MPQADRALQLPGIRQAVGGASRNAGLMLVGYSIPGRRSQGAREL